MVDISSQTIPLTAMRIEVRIRDGAHIIYQKFLRCSYVLEFKVSMVFRGELIACIKNHRIESNLTTIFRVRSFLLAEGIVFP